jgi:hypothetical protein
VSPPFACSASLASSEVTALLLDVALYLHLQRRVRKGSRRDG